MQASEKVRRGQPFSLLRITAADEIIESAPIFCLDGNLPAYNGIFSDKIYNIRGEI